MILHMYSKKADNVVHCQNFTFCRKTQTYGWILKLKMVEMWKFLYMRSKKWSKWSKMGKLAKTIMITILVYIVVY